MVEKFVKEARELNKRCPLRHFRDILLEGTREVSLNFEDEMKAFKEGI
jgi:hypothetical protein